jgi:ABC-type branched-subunit amino acid transport system permease subunit
MAILSLVLLTGVVGQISLCQASFMGIGAYTAGIAIGHGLPFLIAVPIGAAVAGLAAMIVGLPALRLSPLELAIVTLSLAWAADNFLFSWTPLVSGLDTRPVPRPSFAAPAANHTFPGDRNYAWLCLAAFVVIALCVAALRRGRTGAALTALRSSPAATAAMGFSVTWAKLRGFALSGVVAGLAGGLFAGLSQTASGKPFGTLQSISLLAYAVIAGVGNIPGAVVGGAIVTLSTISFSSSSGAVSNPTASSVTTMLTGAVLIAVLLLAPTGLTGLAARGADLVRRRRPPSLPEVADSAARVGVSA